MGTSIVIYYSLNLLLKRKSSEYEEVSEDFKYLFHHCPCFMIVGSLEKEFKQLTCYIV